MSAPRKVQGVAIVTASMLLSALAMNTAMAFPAIRAPGARTGATQQPHTAIVGELKATRTLLEQADHDYKGHRAKAVHEISHAIHVLEHGMGKHHAAGPTGPKPVVEKPKGGNEPQAVSDKQLQQAITQLTAIGGQLTSLKGEHHMKAAEAVQAAIAELNTALKIK